MNSSIRHWKQRFDITRPLVLTRRMLLQGVQYEAGTILDADVKAKFGKHRLKTWWTGRLLRHPEPGEVFKLRTMAEQKPAPVLEPVKAEIVAPPAVVSSTETAVAVAEPVVEQATAVPKARKPLGRKQQ